MLLQACSSLAAHTALDGIIIPHSHNVLTPLRLTHYDPTAALLPALGRALHVEFGCQLRKALLTG
eukprot:2052104-Prymnesium_polylepis.1